MTWTISQFALDLDVLRREIVANCLERGITMTNGRIKLYEFFDNQASWWIEAKFTGKRHPCPICRASGRTRGLVGMLNCYHCHGSGDESATLRRNIAGLRPVR